MDEISKTVRKRLRSDDASPCSAHQTKVFINQRILDQNDLGKMREIHAKTIRYLFEAAQKAYENQKSGKLDSVPLWKQIVLYGDGRIEFRNKTVPIGLKVERIQAECCAGIKTFVQDYCSSCNFNLCEKCGFSCSDCGRFLCRGCVFLFGCGTADNPICEKCTLFN